MDVFVTADTNGVFSLSAPFTTCLTKFETPMIVRFCLTLFNFIAAGRAFGPGTSGKFTRADTETGFTFGCLNGRDSFLSCLLPLLGIPLIKPPPGAHFHDWREGEISCLSQGV